MFLRILSSHKKENVIDHGVTDFSFAWIVCLGLFACISPKSTLYEFVNVSYAEISSMLIWLQLSFGQLQLVPEYFS